jgi:hypothetical protein
MIAYRLEEQHRVYFKCILVCYKASKKHFFFTFLSASFSKVWINYFLPSATRPERTLSSVHSAGGQIDGEKKSARRHFNFRKRERLSFVIHFLPRRGKTARRRVYIQPREKKKNAFFVLLQSQSTETIVADDGDDREENDDECSSSLFVFVYVD